MPPENNNTGNTTPKAPTVGPGSQTQTDLASTIDFFAPASKTNKAIAGYEDVAEGMTGFETDDLVEKTFSQRKSKGKQERPKEETEYEDDSLVAESAEFADDEEGSEEEIDSEETNDEDDAENEDAEEISEEEEHREEAPKGYTLVNVDGEEVKIPDNTKLKLKIDGELKTFTFGELKKVKAGEVSFHKKFEELGIEKKRIKEKAIQAEKEQTGRTSEFFKNKTFTNTLVTAAKNKDFETIINETLAHAEVEPGEFWDHFDTKLEGFYSQFKDLSPTEKQAIQATRRATLKEKQFERREKARTLAEEEAQVETTRSRMAEEAGLTQVDVFDAWDELNNLAQAGKLKKEVINQIQGLDALGKYQYALGVAMVRRSDERISNTINEVAPSLKKQFETIANDLSEVIGVKKLLKMSDKALKQLIRENYGVTENKKLKSESSTTGKSLGDKALPRHKAESSQRNDRSASNKNFRDGVDVWGMSTNMLLK